jgi:hypothetical protein
MTVCYLTREILLEAMYNEQQSFTFMQSFLDRKTSLRAQVTSHRLLQIANFLTGPLYVQFSFFAFLYYFTGNKPKPIYHRQTLTNSSAGTQIAG